jgi:nanoRNase/pAp phosphatase (c-di-AMP/oligoRNAs hydrolase)
MKIYYHAADFDGLCSGAIIKIYNPEAEMIPVDYGDNIIVDDDQAIVADFSFPAMEKIKDLTWIDHHKTAIEQYSPSIHGVRSIDSAACELCWGYFANSLIPKSVKYLGRYDVWDHSDPNTIYFQYGLRAQKNIDPRTNLEYWKELFTDVYNRELINAGKIIYDYQESLDQRTLRNARKMTIYGYSALLVNAVCSPYLFKDIEEDIGISFVIDKDGDFIYSLRSSTVDVSAIAKEYGGGGHAGAAGFKSKEMVF